MRSWKIFSRVLVSPLRLKKIGGFKERRKEAQEERLMETSAREGA